MDEEAVVIIEPERITLTAGSLCVDVNYACLGLVSLDGKELPVRKMTIVLEPGFYPLVTAELVPVPSVARQLSADETHALRQAWDDLYKGPGDGRLVALKEGMTFRPAETEILPDLVAATGPLTNRGGDHQGV
jgi:hypothetical protein